jgi:hypothetical protein
MKSIREKTLEELENEIWPEPSETYPGLVAWVCVTRKKKLNELTPYDLFRLLGQNYSLSYIINVIIDILKEDVFIEALIEPGDLFEKTLLIKKEFWLSHKHHWEAIKDLYMQHKDDFENNDDYKSIRNSFILFDEIYS